MKYYRLTLAVIILVSFAGQMLHGNGMWSFTIQNGAGDAIGFCTNKDFQNKSKIDFNTFPTADISCTSSVNSLFVSKHFSWEPIISKHNREAIISYQNIQEQLYVDKLIEPPQV